MADERITEGEVPDEAGEDAGVEGNESPRGRAEQAESATNDNSTSTVKDSSENLFYSQVSASGGAVALEDVPAEPAQESLLLNDPADTDEAEDGDGDETAVDDEELSDGLVGGEEAAQGSATKGDAEGDTLIGIENLTGSAYNDLLSGDAGANTLMGGCIKVNLIQGLLLFFGEQIGLGKAPVRALEIIEKSGNTWRRGGEEISDPAQRRRVMQEEHQEFCEKLVPLLLSTGIIEPSE